MKLSQWARKQGIHYNTAYRWFHQGKIPNARQLDTGTILVEEITPNTHDNKTYIYCRVSSHNKKQDLQRQVERCEQFCLANGWAVEKVYKEVASGMNDNRKVFTKLLNQRPKRIVVEHKDRATRFGFNYIETLLKQLGTELIVIHRDKEDENDLMKDLISIITSFCCRLYGLRRGNNKSKKIKKIINDQNI